MVPLTRSIGEFVAGLRYQDVPDSVARIVRNGFTDVVACIALGRSEPVVEALRRVTAGPSGEAGVCFGPQRASAMDAALINGTAAHAHDYDDIGIGAHPAHPSAVLVPAILAEAEACGADGRRMTTAYAAGYEVWGELARRDADPHHLKGLHPTGVFGGIAAAAACANLLGLDAKRAAHAIGIAASQAAGLVANFGSMTKPFHAGRAAQAGVMSARLAKQGMTAAPDVIEQPKGFLHVVSPRGAVDLASPPMFGREWWILRNGLGFKLYPMCYGAHRSLDGMLALVTEHDVVADEVVGVEVEMSPNQQINLVNHDPRTGTEAKFSEEFAMAVAIIARRATMAELTDDFVRRDDVRALMKKVRITTIPGVGDDRPTSPPTDRITVTLVDGRRLERRLQHPRGHPTRPLSGEELWTKFSDCVSGAMSAATARSMFDRLQQLEQVASVHELSASAVGSDAALSKQGQSSVAGTPQIKASRPLEGIVVVEIGHSVAAPFAGHVLGDLGAIVIKVENPDGGDDARKWGPPFWHGAAFVFQALNRNKFSAAIDLKDDAEREALRRFLVEKADIVLQNMRPGLIGKLGLDAGLRRDNPRLIYCNLAAFGAKGPLVDRPGYDPLMQAFGGIMSVTGEEGRPPVRVGPSIVDVGTGMWAVIGILSALHRRDLTGEGCEIDTSLFETALSWVNTHAASYLASGRVPGRRGSEHAGMVPYKIFEASDGYVMIAAGNDNLFRRLAGALGNPQWLDDPRFASNPERVKNRDTVNASIQAVVGTRTCADWVSALEQVGVPCAPLQSMDQVLEHPQTKALDILQTTPDGRMTMVGLPVSFNGERPDLRRGPPSLGADTGLILGNLAGRETIAAEDRKKKV